VAKLLINCVKQVPFKSRMMTAGVISDDPSIGQFRSIFNDCDSKQEKPDNISGGVMVQSINHATGQNTWKMMPPDYDYNQELARAAFADMLHDSERNRLYYEGLEAAIKLKREAGEQVHVLDIGTGTGLLSMMAAKLGADSITACEEFRPMAECAARVIRDNGYEDKIKLVRKRSTELQVGPGLDLEQRANILVTEVFDTELIGEGAISTYNHANKFLLTEDRLVVPGMARIWAQVVTSPKCRAWSHHVQDNGLAPASSLASGGHTSLSLHDVQLSQLSSDLWSPVSQPRVVFTMDLACRQGPIPDLERSITSLTSEHEDQVTCDAVFMWWDCWTDPQETILLSCAPAWASHHPPDRPLPWRDHWMQAIYYPKASTEVKKGESFHLVSCHDEYSLWFDVVKTPVSPTDPISLPDPQPGLHLAMSRTRLGQVNNKSRNEKFVKNIKQLILNSNKNKTVLVISEQSLLGLMVAKLGAENVNHICEENHYLRDYIQSCAIVNKIEDRISLHNSDWLTSADLSTVEVVLAEPHFTVSVLPWHNLLFWFIINKLDLPPHVRISPCKARLYIVPVHFVDLWKIRSPLHTVEGFKMNHFDAIIEAAADISDNNVEPQPLWEYPSIALGPPVQITEFNLTTKVPTTNTAFTGEIQVSDKSKPLNGLALWMDWDLDQDGTNVLSGGPVQGVNLGHKIVWDMDSKQGVHFFKPTENCSKIIYNITFVPSEGDFNFKFNQL